ncbi:hypothetical protein F5Y19DRAFT_221058 [Xylariaceae sp. FL1651]|nr:hypothetical protein F5Y19DRAFT_221058 [Xylariaceae sp. FL1651]
MGRTEPSVVRPPAAFRRDARAKRARATINKVIPALLVAHPRARRGIEQSELIIDPPPLNQSREVEVDHSDQNDVRERRKNTNAKTGRRKRGNESDESVRKEEYEPEGQHSRRKSEAVKKNGDSGRSKYPSVDGPRLTLCVADTLTAARSLLDLGLVPKGSTSQQQQQQQQQYHKQSNTGNSATPHAKVKVGILNMASPLSPGGGFLNGATSQEESLCMSTTLLPALRDEFYRLPELGVVYTPDVLVFRSASPLTSASASAPASASAEGKDPKSDRWFVDVVSAAMLRLPETEDGRYASPADRELVARKMRAVMRVFAAKGCTRVVLGAWGCGAYGNPTSEVAEAWRRILVVPDHRTERNHVGDEKGSGHSKVSGKARDKRARNGDTEAWYPPIEHIVFAIKDLAMAVAFARAFGEDLLPIPTLSDEEHSALSSTLDEEIEDSVEAMRMRELRTKIEELELQVGQAQSPHLRAGLEVVLAGLKKQLPCRDIDEHVALRLRRDPSHRMSDDDNENDSEEDEYDDSEGRSVDIEDENPQREASVG